MPDPGVSPTAERRPAAGVSVLGRLSRGGARLVVLFLVALVAAAMYSAASTPTPVPGPDAGDTGADAHLYRAIVERVRVGDGYYAAAAAEQRARRFPLFPFVTVRQPLVASVVAVLGGEDHARVALLGVMIMVTLVVAHTLRAKGVSTRQLLLAVLACAIALAFPASQPLFHESWAAMLIVLSLALHDSGWVVAAAGAGLAAALARELAVPYLLVMGTVALVQRHWRDAALWGGTLLLAAGALVVHAVRVANVRVASDLHSAGWSARGGLPFLLDAIHGSTPLVLLPRWTTMLLVPLSLLGWLDCRLPMGSRAFLFVTGFSAGMLWFGRPANFYWAALPGPLIMLGLAFGAGAMRSLWRQAALTA